MDRNKIILSMFFEQTNNNILCNYVVLIKNNQLLLKRFTVIADIKTNYTLFIKRTRRNPTKIDSSTHLFLKNMLS